MTVGLPEEEQRELDDIRQRVAEDDPRFAAKLTKAPPRYQSLPPRVLRLIGLPMIYVVGLLAVMAGVSASSAALVALGAAVAAFGPVVMVIQAWRDRARRGQPD